MLALTAAAGLAALAAILGAASLRLPAFTGFLLAVYTLMAGEIVFLTEFLSLVHRVDAQGYAIGELILLVAALTVWNRRGRPRPRFPTARPCSFNSHPAIAFLALVVVAAVCYQAFLVVGTPPNTYDSLAYHLARAAEWYQRGAVEYYPSHSESLNAPQPNAEMLTLYTFAFAQRDTAAATPQLFAELACVVAVYGIAIRLGFSRPASTFAALLTATLSLVALQSVTTQNDLLASSFVVVALYFLLGGTTSELALAGLSIGLAVGTKATTVIALPLFLVAAALVKGAPNVWRVVGYACVGFAMVGAYGYVLNVVHTGRPLGDPDAFGPIRQPDPTFAGTASTAARLGYKFVDFSGYPVPSQITEPIEAVGRHGFRIARIPVNPAGSTVLDRPFRSPFRFTVNTSANETRSYLGPLGALVVVPLALAFLVAVTLGRAPPLLLVPALAIPCFVLGIAFSTRYNEFSGRYLLPGIILAMPLTAWLYGRKQLAAAVASVGVLTLVFAHMQNNVKPSGSAGGPPIWSMTRAEAQSVTRDRLAQVVESVERHVPDEARLGYVLRYNDWIYPFYGPKLTRRLVQLPRDGLFRAAERNGLSAIIVAGTITETSGNWRRMAFPRTQWALLLRRSR